MADDADKAQVVIDEARERQVAEICSQQLTKGKPGDCDLCGHWSGRLVNGVCAPCRDKYGLP